GRRGRAQADARPPGRRAARDVPRSQGRVRDVRRRGRAVRRGGPRAGAPPGHRLEAAPARARGAGEGPAMNVGSWFSRGQRCMSEADLSRALAQGPSEALERHLEGCPACAGRWREARRTRDLARQLPWRAPAAAELEQTRTSLLVALAAEQAR